MKKTIYSVLLAGVCVLAAGCKDDSYLGGKFNADGAGSELRLKSVIVSQLTPDIRWQKGDRIALTTAYPDQTSLNRVYVCTEDGQRFTNETGYPIYIKGNTTLSAYWPVTGLEGQEPVLEFNTLLQSEQTDYLFAQAKVIREQGEVALDFDHAMAQLQVTLVKPTEERITGYRLGGIRHTATVDPYTLELTLAEAPVDYVASGDSLTGFVLNLLPQTVKAADPVPATLILNGAIRSYTLALGDLTLEAGRALAVRIDITSGAATIEFTNRDADWIDSGKGKEMASAVAFRATTAVGFESADETIITPCFEVGDQAGVFAVLNGQIVPAINNVRLNYNIAGAWEPETAIAFTDELKGASFYAYTPYNAAATMNPSAADPFAEMVAAFEVPTQQASVSDYKKADLMTTGACTLSAYNTIDLKLQHRLSLICMELPNSSYTFTNADLPLYVKAASSNARFERGGLAYRPYFDEETQTYRLLVRTSDEGNLTISFDGPRGEQSTALDNLIEVQGGEYARYVIDGGVQLTEITLETGDYYCQDGSIIKHDDAAAIAEHTTNIIGVVCRIGTNESVVASRPACCHALVLALSETKAKWSSKGSTTADENNAGWKTWYQNYGLVALSSDKAANIALSELEAVGYDYTLSWRQVPTDLSIGGYTVSVVDGFHAADSAFCASHVRPAVSSEWFVPSLREWLQIKEAETAVSTSLTEIGATPLSWDGTGTDKVYYWSSNIRAATSMWTYTGAPLDVAMNALIHADSKDSRIYRYLIAF